MVDFALPAPVSSRPSRLPRTLAARLRLWRRHRARRRFVALVLSEAHSAGVLADIGVPAGSPSLLERFAIALVQSPR